MRSSDTTKWSIVDAYTQSASEISSRFSETSSSKYDYGNERNGNCKFIGNEFLTKLKILSQGRWNTHKGEKTKASSSIGSFVKRIVQDYLNTKRTRQSLSQKFFTHKHWLFLVQRIFVIQLQSLKRHNLSSFYINQV